MFQSVATRVDEQFRIEVQAARGWKPAITEEENMGKGRSPRAANTLRKRSKILALLASGGAFAAMFGSTTLPCFQADIAQTAFAQNAGTPAAPSAAAPANSAPAAAAQSTAAQSTAAPANNAKAAVGEPSAELLALLKTFRAEFVDIKPGTQPFPATFRMGSAQVGTVAEPVREVRMTKPFAFAKYEIPQNLWQAVMGENPSRWKGPRNSSEMFTWEESVEFCRRATAAMRAAKLIEATESIRLPSEAEWEYCARAGTTTEYSFGDDASQLGQYGWFTGNAAGNDPPVGAKKPNAWGLYDMHGYLWEWCADTWHGDYDGAPLDGSAWTDGGEPAKRVLRSGSWKDKADALRSAARRSGDVRLRDDAVGLRCVLSKTP
jgi:formylglycine-generating enzyme required for sulfatase activity